MEEDDARDSTGNLLRPYSTPTMPSRFPSLRRLTSSEPYRHRSLPAEGAHSPGSDRPDSEITFAVLYDDGPDYHLGHYDETGSIRSGRPESVASYAPSFRTRDSHITSDEHRDPDFVGNQRLLAEGYLNANHSTEFHDRDSRYPARSEETLAMNSLHNLDESKNPRNLTLHTPMTDRSISKGSHETWCTCDEEHDHPRDVKDPSKFGHIGPMDLEAQNGPPTPTPLIKEEKPEDFIVKFKGPKDPLNPKSWPSKKRWAATFVMASFTFVSPLASSMVAPALGQIQKEFHITNSVESQIVLSIFVLAYAIGPLVLGPLSELYGRVIVLQSSNVLFLAFNLACGFAQSKQQLMAFRFLSGLGGSAPLAIGGGVLGDLFMPEERGKAMGMYAMGPLLGPALGPIVGGWVAEKSTWRWMFWATSIADFFILVSGYIWQPESYGPYILHKEAARLRKTTGNPQWRAEGESEVQLPVYRKILNTMTRSFKMLGTQPIVQVMSVYMAFSYGILYLVLSTYPILWAKKYGEGPGVGGLNYISIGLGFFIGAPVCGKTNDKIYHKLKARDPRGQGKPEFRMPLIIPFSLFVPIGLFIYGWSAEAHAFWLIPNIGAFFFGMGTIAAFQCVTTYLVDTYARFAASAVAAVTVLRSLAGFGFPLFAPAMYHALGYGWGNTVLAFAGIFVGLPVPVLLWIFGEKLRKNSSMAMKGKPPGGPGGPGGGPPGAGGPGMGPGGKGPGSGPPPGAGPDSKKGGPPGGAPRGPPTQ